MDPLTALSLAGNIVQLVDFSTAILLRTKCIYESQSGLLSPHKELDFVTSDLASTCDLITTSFSPLTEEGLSPNDRALRELCGVCQSLIVELRNKLDTLKITGSNGKPTIWESFNTAVRSVWTGPELDVLVRRLTSIKEQVQLRIMVGYR